MNRRDCRGTAEESNRICDPREHALTYWYTGIARLVFVYLAPLAVKRILVHEKHEMRERRGRDILSQRLSLCALRPQRLPSPLPSVFFGCRNDRICSFRSVRLVLEIPEDTAATLNFMPEDLPEQFRIAAAIKWYELGRVSQGRAAEIAGLSRSAFIELLVEYGVSPFQESATDLRQIP